MKIKNEKGSVISRIFKDNKYCWLAFGCSAVIMLIVYICYSLIPFGDVTILSTARFLRSSMTALLR